MVEGVFKIPIRLLVALLLSSKQGQMVNAVITALFLIWRIFMKKQTQRKNTLIRVKLLITQELFGKMIKSGFSTEPQWNSKKFKDLPNIVTLYALHRKRNLVLIQHQHLVELAMKSFLQT